MAYNSFGYFKIKLTAGTAFLFVRVVDNMGAVTTSFISTPVIVTNNPSTIKSIVDSLNSNNCASSFVIGLNSGDLQVVSQLVNGLASSLNMLANTSTSVNNSSNSTAANTIDERVSARLSLTSFVCSMPVSDISSVKLIASSLSTLTNTIAENSLASSVKIKLKYHLDINIFF